MSGLDFFLSFYMGFGHLLQSVALCDSSNLGSFQPLFLHDIFLSPSGTSKTWTLVTLLSIPKVLWALFFLYHLFCQLFRLDNAYWSVFKLTNSLLYLFYYWVYLLSFDGTFFFNILLRSATCQDQDYKDCYNNKSP